MTTLPNLALYQWYTIRHGLYLIMQQLLDAEDPNGAEELERQRLEECAYTQNLRATIQRIIDTREKELNLTPIQEQPPMTTLSTNGNPTELPPNTRPSHSNKVYFVHSFNALAAALHADNIARGFWPADEERNNAELIALMHSELSEALEALRHNNPPSDHIPGFTGIEEELADCIIRIMDMSAARGYRVAEALITKVEFNRSRPYKHGKLF